MAVKTIAPVHGTCRWVGKEVNGQPLLSITTDKGVTHVYEVEEVFGGVKLYRVEPTGEVVVYTVSTVYQTCTCPDFQRRERVCKHLRAVSVALPHMQK